MGLALIDGLLALGRISSSHPELTGLGRPENFLERQVNRWRGQLEGYRKFEGWTGLKELGEIDCIAQWLAANCPAAFLPGLVHGDFHIGNVMYRPDGPGLAAIFDWELGTIGDPLLDLANLIATWPDENGGHTVSRTVEPWEGFPTIAAMIAHYSANTRRETREFRWYAVLACYRLGIVVEGTYARACAGKASPEIVLERSRRWIENWPYGES